MVVKAERTGPAVPVPPAQMQQAEVVGAVGIKDESPWGGMTDAPRAGWGEPGVEACASKRMHAHT